MCLTEKGWAQSFEAGKRIQEITGEESVRFFVSPYVRTRETLNGIARAWGGIDQVEWAEHALLREIELGDVPNESEYERLISKQNSQSSFFFRFPM